MNVTLPGTYAPCVSRILTLMVPKRGFSRTQTFPSFGRPTAKSFSDTAGKILALTR